jgi:hypothetical protein
MSRRWRFLPHYIIIIAGRTYVQWTIMKEHAGGILNEWIPSSQGDECRKTVSILGTRVWALHGCRTVYTGLGLLTGTNPPQTRPNPQLMIR